MIYTVNKYHKTEVGETSSTEEIKRADATEAYEKALAVFYEQNKNYMADKSVLEWKTSIICPMDMTIKKQDGYTRVTPQPSEEVAE